MPAPVLVVHDEQNTRELAVAALRDAFLEVVGFDDPLKALDAIRSQFPRPCPGHASGVRSWQTERCRAVTHGANEAARN